MKRNAFELLAAGARSSGKPKTKAQTPSGADKGAYTTCPLCQRTVPIVFANAHISTCLLSVPARHQQQQHPVGGGATPAAGLSTAGHASTPQPPRPPAQQPQPLLPSQRHQPQPSQQKLPLRLSPSAPNQEALGMEDRSTCSSPSAVGSGASLSAAVLANQSHGCTQDGLHRRQQHEPQVPDAATTPSDPLSAHPQLPTQLTQPASTAGGSQPARPSAFDVMRQGQRRASSRCHTFFLERTADGRWLGHWWAKGCATPEQQRLLASSLWTTTVSVASATSGSEAGGGGGPAGAAAGGRGVTDSLSLATNVPPADGGLVAWSSVDLPSNTLPPEGRWRGGPSALKSALQKAVRLRRGGCAVRAAMHLAKEDPAQLLRRLSVICVEDAILHPGLPLVVWLMAAQAKGYGMGSAHVSALLCLTYQLAEVGVRDALPDPWDGGGGGEAAAGASTGGSQVGDPGHPDLPAAEACLVRCLQLRASYGGMACDVRMLRGFAAYWSSRFRGDACAPPEAASSRTGAGPEAALPEQQAPGTIEGQTVDRAGASAGGGGGASDGTSGWSGKPHGSDDAYFSSRLQVGDASPGCGAFMPASQLLAEQAAEQSSLQRLAAGAAPGPTQPYEGGAWQHGGSAAGCAAGGAVLATGPTGRPRGSGEDAGAGVVRPQWLAAAGADTGADGATGGSASSGGPSPSRWFEYLCDLYERVPVPGPLSRAASVGPLRRSDVPLSAVDFHVSDVVPQLLARPEVQAAAEAASSGRGGTGEGEAEDALKSAMWLFRSSTNPKCWIHSLSPCCHAGVADGPGPSSCHTRGVAPPAQRRPGRPVAACLEHSGMAAQVAGEEQARQRLSVLWAAAAPWADRFSVSYISRRFGPP